MFSAEGGGQSITPQVHRANLRGSVEPLGSNNTSRISVDRGCIIISPAIDDLFIIDRAIHTHIFVLVEERTGLRVISRHSLKIGSRLTRTSIM